MSEPMRVWPVQDAKARFSELVDDAVTSGPQLVTRRGVDMAVVVAIDEWRRLQQGARPSLKQLLLAEEARSDGLSSERGRARRRPVEHLE